MPRIFDNIELRLHDGLLESLAGSNRMDACVGYFNLRGWRILSDAIQALPQGTPELPPGRVLIGMHGRPEDEVREKLSVTSPETPIDNSRAHELRRQVAAELRAQLMLGVPRSDDETGLRVLSGQLRSGRVQVKVFLRSRLHAKLYLCHRSDVVAPLVGFVGSSNLTMPGLRSQGELNVDVVEGDAAQKLANWFEARWTDRFAVDISTELADIIDESWAGERPGIPHEVYVKMAYHLSREARAGLSEFGVPPEFDGVLLDFQAAALKIAARHLARRGGVMIGDVVGLGKTMTGTALAKLYQDEFGAETLILCPKNLVPMWQQYVDRFRLLARVQSLSTARRDLPGLRRFRLVMIDESHNLRNRDGRTYESVRDYIERNGSKCVLLSATPYNKHYEDLASQLRLFIGEEEDLGIRPERLLREVGEARFLELCEGRPTSIRAFEKSPFPDDWRDLMQLYMVRRTRTFIKDHYARHDSEGRAFLMFPDGSRSYFPERLAHTVVPEAEGDHDPYHALHSPAVLDALNSLHLPRYGLAGYLRDGAELSDAEHTLVSNLSRAGTRLVGLVRTSLFKRVESSGAAFVASVDRHLAKNELVLKSIKETGELPVGRALTEMAVERDSDAPLEDELGVDDNGADALAALRAAPAHRISWIRAEYFDDALVEHLEHDTSVLRGLRNEIGAWSADTDCKVARLHQLITVVHPEERIVVFTEFADTANYVASALRGRGVTNLEVVTGQHEDPTSVVRRFSPKSNGSNEAGDVRILISTDVLSEGQNLQDAAIVVSFDLPWAIIKLVQRAGRVDRIGQQSDTINVYSFLPPDGLEAVLALRRRVRERLKENEEVLGADEQFFDDEDMRGVVLSGVYDETVDRGDDGEEVDLASFAYEIYKRAIAADPSLENRIAAMPDVVHATKSVQHDPAVAAGVLVYTSSYGAVDHLTWIDKNGDRVSESPLEILRAAACPAGTLGLERQDAHHDLVAKAVEAMVARGPVHIEGALTGVRRRIYLTLRDWIRDAEGTVFHHPELEEVVGLIYRYPLKDHAKDVIARAFRAGLQPQAMSELCVRLHQEENLVLHRPDSSMNDLRIVCSMGLRDDA